MQRKLTRYLSAMAFLFQLTQTAFAQDFRVYTKVFADKPGAVARSLTIFHAGKAYDHIDVFNEVIIFDKKHQRFIILNTERELATEVTFDEVKRKLNIARDEYKKEIAKIDAKGQTKPSVVAGQLQFELAPTFDEVFQQATPQLTLKSPHLTYGRYDANADPEKVNAYLEYADWMCRLNYVLYPSVFLPELRLELNNSLRQKQLLPVEVELAADFKFKIQNRAEHTFTWKLANSHRQKIHEWETMLREKQIPFIPFAEYQKVVLNGNPKKR